MNTKDYWQEAAEAREQEAHTEAEKYLKQMLEMYDDALGDIQKEVNAIKGNYMKRFGIDEETADYFLSRELRKYPSDKLLQRLLTAGSDEERAAILDFIHADGLSTRAYAARMEWFNGVRAKIRLRMIQLELELRETGELIRRNAYKNNYYRVIDDTAREMNMGISFGIIDDAAVSEVMNKPWHGKRFSKRIWDNTERLANEAQEIVGRYLVSGRSLDKAAKELAEAFEVEKFHATTLVHTETAHARAMSDKKAYEDMGAEEYRYIATLDEVTCDVCGPLDGKYFKVADIAEGENFPVMHPRCRCTSCVAMQFGKRRARNPITGRNEILPDITYDEWRQNMAPEGKAAFAEAQRGYKNKRRKSIDKSQKSDIINTESTIDKAYGSGLMELNRAAKRREANIGAFKNLEIPMQKRSVLNLAEKYGISTEGLTFKIQRSEKLLALPFYGSTDYNSVGRIDLFPNAFVNEEQLIRTVIHEKCHVKQLHKYGKTYAQNNLDLMEKQAERFENLYYSILRKRVR